MPLDEVLRKAGLLPPTPDEDPRLKELIHWFMQLDETSQTLILDMLEGLVEQQIRREQQAQKHQQTHRSMENTQR